MFQGALCSCVVGLCVFVLQGPLFICVAELCMCCRSRMRTDRRSSVLYTFVLQGALCVCVAGSFVYLCCRALYVLQVGDENRQT